MDGTKRKGLLDTWIGYYLLLLFSKIQTRMDTIIKYRDITFLHSFVAQKFIATVYYFNSFQH